MTKHDEIQQLDATIATFGPDSYIGPWLSEHRDRIVADIGNDHTPEALMPAEARREAARIVAEARTEAETITRQAGELAAKTREEAYETVRAIKARAREHLATLAQKL